jgi:uncharacterized zinc-type alcohol dehydrogenase-like protein
MTSDPVTFESPAGTFELIVNTVSARPDISAYLMLLAIDGTAPGIGPDQASQPP